MTFANRRCINEQASISLLAPKLEPPPSFSYQGLNWKPYDVLCGPVRIKPLMDVTEQSLQLSLFHPSLVTRRPHVLWLEIKDFFTPEYNDISVTSDTSAAAAKRSGWRSGAPFQHRLRQQAESSKVKPIPVQVREGVDRYTYMYVRAMICLDLHVHVHCTYTCTSYVYVKIYACT